MLILRSGRKTNRSAAIKKEQHEAAARRDRRASRQSQDELERLKNALEKQERDVDDLQREDAYKEELVKLQQDNLTDLEKEKRDAVVSDQKSQAELQELKNTLEERQRDVEDLQREVATRNTRLISHKQNTAFCMLYKEQHKKAVDRNEQQHQQMVKLQQKNYDLSIRTTEARNALIKLTGIEYTECFNDDVHTLELKVQQRIDDAPSGCMCSSMLRESDASSTAGQAHCA